jgi:hypothetical protein
VGIIDRKGKLDSAFSVRSLHVLLLRHIVLMRELVLLAETYQLNGGIRHLYSNFSYYIEKGFLFT